MDDTTPIEAAPLEIPPPAQPVPLVAPTSTAPETRYEGNSFDLYALIAGIVGVTSLGLCFTGNSLIYCLPFVPLVFGIIALRNSARALNPGRTRTMGWIGVAAGIVGVVTLVCFVLFLTVYIAFIFRILGNVLPNLPRRP